MDVRLIFGRIRQTIILKGNKMEITFKSFMDAVPVLVLMYLLAPVVKMIFNLLDHSDYHLTIGEIAPYVSKRNFIMTAVEIIGKGRASEKLFAKCYLVKSVSYQNMEPFLVKKKTLELFYDMDKTNNHFKG